MSPGGDSVVCRELETVDLMLSLTSTQIQSIKLLKVMSVSCTTCIYRYLYEGYTLVPVCVYTPLAELCNHSTLNITVKILSRGR